jgi:hypothetical protein
MKRMNKIFFTTKHLFFLTTLLTVFSTFAASEIVDVRRNITLSEDEVPIKDFYIKIADSGGLKKNLVVKAVRKINVKDSGLKSVGDFMATVGLLKIIHVEGKVAVAREFKLVPRDNEPMLEQIGIMTGDEIDLSDSYIDTSKPKTAEVKKKVTEVVDDKKMDVAVVVIEKSEAKPEIKDAREPAQLAVPVSDAVKQIKPETIQGI